MMRDVLIAGIYDADIRREVLGVEGIVDRSVNEIISLLEKKEMARDANIVTGNTFTISSRQEAGSIFRAPKVTCPPSGFLGPNFEICRNCFRSRRNQQKSKFSNPPLVSGIFEQGSDSLQIISQISAVSSPVAGPWISSSIHVESLSSDISKSRKLCLTRLDHHIFSSEEWKRARFMEHPSMTFTLSVRKADYKSIDIKCPDIKKGSINAKLDTCTQSCLWSLKDCLSFGF